MFTIDKINCEVDKYNKFTNYNILRYLLHLTMKQTIGSERRSLYTEFGRKTIAEQFVQYVDTSILKLESFISTGNPYDIDQGLNTFFDFCGLINLHNSTNKSNLFAGTIIKYPNIFQSKLTELYKHINSANLIGCVDVYNNIMSDALKYSIEHYNNKLL